MNTIINTELMKKYKLQFLKLKKNMNITIKDP